MKNLAALGLILVALIIIRRPRPGPTPEQELAALCVVASYAYDCARMGIPFDKVTNNVRICYPWGPGR